MPSLSLTHFLSISFFLFLSLSLSFQIAAYDDMFTPQQLTYIRTETKRYLSPIFAGGFIKVEDDEGNDNVQWIVSMERPLNFVKTPLWPVFKSVASDISNGKEGWFPYDVALNVIRSADCSRIHGDVANNQDSEWTMLVYLNPEWREDSYGETTWFTKNAEFDNEINIEAEIQPLYGRVVIFDGLIPHSARPPAIDYRGARYSLAVKMAASRWHAVRNVLTEKLHESAEGYMNCAFDRESAVDREDFSKRVSQVVAREVPAEGKHAKIVRDYWQVLVSDGRDGSWNFLHSIAEEHQEGAELEAIYDALRSVLEKFGDLCKQSSISVHGGWGAFKVPVL